MNKLISILLFLALDASAQPSWSWAKDPGTPADERILATCANRTLGTYSTGFFRGTNITFGNVTLNSQGNQDFFLVKYDVAGNVIWATSAGGSSSDGGISLGTDNAGNIYVLGYFQSASITIAGQTVVNADTTGSFDAYFLAKYDSLGTLAWIKSPTGFFFNGVIGQAGSLKVDSLDEIVIAGHFASRALILDTFNLVNTDTGYTHDIFVAKYDTGGTVLWAAHGGGKGMDETEDVAVSPGGGIFLIGETSSQNTKFDSVTLPPTYGQQDFFIAHYDSLGGLLWAKRIGGNQNDWGRSITWRKGYLYLESTFQSPSINIFNTSVNKTGSSDLLFARISELGNVVWTKTFAGNFSASHIIIDDVESIYATGEFYDKSLTIGSNILSNTDTAGGTADIFVLRMDTSGAINWVESVGGGADDISRSLAVSNGSELYVSGWFSSASISFNTSLLNNNGLIDPFLAKKQNAVSIKYVEGRESKWSVFPNPACTFTSIKYFGNQSATLQLLNTRGQLILQCKVRDTCRIDLSSFDSGVYYIRVFDDRESSTEKLLIQK